MFHTRTEMNTTMHQAYRTPIPCIVFVLFSFFFFLSRVSFVSAQHKDEFPASWQGIWSGDLNIYKGQNLQQTLPMSVEIKRIDSVRYVFALIYGSDPEKGRRPYELIIKNAAKGEYVFDEKNSIEMEAWLFDNKLFCWFTVQGTQLMSTYEKRGDSIISEIVAGKNQPLRTTGGQTFNGEAIPEVQAFALSTLQRAVLKKVLPSKK